MQLPITQHSERRRTSGADQRIAGEGAAMAPLRHALADSLCGDGHPDRQAVSDRLREAQDVGHDVFAREGEGAARPKPGLDLVTYKKDAARVAPLPDIPEIAIGRNADAAFALDRLDDYGCDRVVPHPVHSVEVVERG